MEGIGWVYMEALDGCTSGALDGCTWGHWIGVHGGGGGGGALDGCTWKALDGRT